VLCYVNIEHPIIMNDPKRRRARLIKLMEAKMRFEELSGQPCLISNYLDISAETMLKMQIRAILISGNSTNWSEYDFTDFGELFKLIKDYAIPILGLCGGHQLIARAYDGKIAPMRPLRPGEDDPLPHLAPGFYKEKGFLEVEVVKEYPLFQCLSSKIVVNEAHHGEIKELPKEFEILASGDACRIQAIRHHRKLIFGTQFHPENYDDKHSDGKIILQNFFRIAGILSPFSFGERNQ
jgi:GMP synthase-like glutamine amidotransferase